MIGIIDYGLGNINAFFNLYNSLNIPCKIASSPSDILTSEKLILPGVGSFDGAMNKLNESGLRESLNHKVTNESSPILGICVGMQIMAYKSEEGSQPGLGWIDGEVKKIQSDKSLGKDTNPLPHMGWNEINIRKNSTLLEKLNRERRFYFLHSYFFKCNDEQDIIATSDYGHKFPAIINHKNIYGIQCHPEKSHINGIELLRSFANINSHA